jgi:hypothetical protein
MQSLPGADAAREWIAVQRLWLRGTEARAQPAERVAHPDKECGNKEKVGHARRQPLNCTRGGRERVRPQREPRIAQRASAGRSERARIAVLAAAA